MAVDQQEQSNRRPRPERNDNRNPQSGGEGGDDLIDRVVHINRVAKVVKGGRRFSFSALVVVGDGKGKVGVGLGKANEVPEAIRKGTDQAKKTMFQVALKGTTIPHPVKGDFGACLLYTSPSPRD